MDVKQLVNTAATGDERAFTSLTRYLTPRLEKWLEREFGSMDSSDLIQDTLSVVAAKLSSFEMHHEAAFLAWVFRIARYVALGALRQQAKWDRELEPSGTPRTGPVTWLDRSERLNRFQHELELLSPSLRQAVENILLGGDARDLADKLGLEWATIRGYESRATKLLSLRMSTPQ